VLSTVCADACDSVTNTVRHRRETRPTSGTVNLTHRLHLLSIPGDSMISLQQQAGGNKGRVGGRRGRS